MGVLRTRLQGVPLAGYVRIVLKMPALRVSVYSIPAESRTIARRFALRSHKSKAWAEQQLLASGLLTIFLCCNSMVLAF